MASNSNTRGRDRLQCTTTTFDSIRFEFRNICFSSILLLPIWIGHFPEPIIHCYCRRQWSKNEIMKDNLSIRCGLDPNRILAKRSMQSVSDHGADTKGKVIDFRMVTGDTVKRRSDQSHGNAESRTLLLLLLLLVWVTFVLPSTFVVVHLSIGGTQDSTSLLATNE